MPVRVTDNMRMHHITRNLGQLRTRQAEAGNVASTGLKLQKASDDPVGAARLTQLKSGLEHIKTLRGNVSTAVSDVDLAESSIAQSTEILNRARELAMQGSSGSLNAGDRVMLADEMAALRTELVAVSNAKGSYGYLFAGHKTDTPAFDANGIYQGDSGERRIEVANGLVLQTNVLGSDVFGGGGSGTDLFAVLGTLETALRANDPTAVAAELTNLDSGLEQLNQARSSVGLIHNRLDIALQSLDRTETSFTRQQSDVSEADPFTALSDLTAVSSTLEQAISVARSLLMSDTNRF